MSISPQTDETSVVLIGTFAPSLFHPLWFEARRLIGKQEADEAKIGVLHPDITQFTTGKLAIEVQANRFVVRSTLIPEAIRDLLTDTFGVHLGGTPILSMGINRAVHFDVGSLAIQHRIGAQLAPRMPWGDWGKRIEEDDASPERRGGLISLKMQQHRGPNEPAGHVQVRIEPSDQVRSSGIFMEVNNHYRLAERLEAADSAKMVEILASQWLPAHTCAEDIIEQIMSLAKKEPTQ